MKKILWLLGNLALVWNSHQVIAENSDAVEGESDGVFQNMPRPIQMIPLGMIIPISRNLWETVS